MRERGRARATESAREREKASDRTRRRGVSVRALRDARFKSDDSVSIKFAGTSNAGTETSRNECHQQCCANHNSLPVASWAPRRALLTPILSTKA